MKIKNKKKKLGKNGIFRFFSPHHVMARFSSLHTLSTYRPGVKGRVNELKREIEV
jgi:hypothetical protein